MPVPEVLMERGRGTRVDSGRAIPAVTPGRGLSGDFTAAALEAVAVASSVPSAPAGALLRALMGEAARSSIVAVLSCRSCARRSRIFERASISLVPLLTVVVGDSGRFCQIAGEGDVRRGKEGGREQRGVSSSSRSSTTNTKHQH